MERDCTAGSQPGHQSFYALPLRLRTKDALDTRIVFSGVRSRKGASFKGLENLVEPN